MQSISEGEGARLMAQWRATGGALESHPVEAPFGDAGLKAAEMTMPSFTHPCFGIDAGDDGLAVPARTFGRMEVFCSVDDGLAATGPNIKSCGGPAAPSRLR